MRLKHRPLERIRTQRPPRHQQAIRQIFRPPPPAPRARTPPAPPPPPPNPPPIHAMAYPFPRPPRAESRTTPARTLTGIAASQRQPDRRPRLAVDELLAPRQQPCPQ